MSIHFKWTFATCGFCSPRILLCFFFFFSRSNALKLEAWTHGRVNGTGVLWKGRSLLPHFRKSAHSSASHLRTPVVEIKESIRCQVAVSGQSAELWSSKWKCDCDLRHYCTLRWGERGLQASGGVAPTSTEEPAQSSVEVYEFLSEQDYQCFIITPTSLCLIWFAGM